MYGINQFSDWTPEEFRGGWLFPIFWKRADSISRLYSSKLAHAAELIMHGFHSIKWVGVLLIPPVWWMLVYHKVISPAFHWASQTICCNSFVLVLVYLERGSVWIIKEHNTVTRSGLIPGLSTQSPTTLIIKQLHVPLYHILIEVQNDQNLISLLLEWLYWQFPLHAEQLVSSLQIWAITNDILVKRDIIISPSSFSPKLNLITWAIFNFLLHEIIH